VTTLAKHLLILDIDESLVYSRENPLDPNFNFQLDSYQVTKRPFLDEFINRVVDWFDVAIWTAATDDYAQEIIQQVFPDPHQLKFIWSRKRCALRFDYEKGDYYWVKDLKKVKRLGYELEKVLVIEDEPRSTKRNYGNLILTSPFDGNLHDKELKTLLYFLEWISKVENVRRIEKRSWRSFRLQNNVNRNSQ
jgi:RNA polymerase II subunit A small phosphatase-like protein